MYEKRLSDTRKKSSVLELEPLDVLNPELDYEYSVHSLYSKSSNISSLANLKERHVLSVKPNPLAKLSGRYSGKPMFPPKSQVNYRMGILIDLPIKAEDYNQCHDYDSLDLHRMVEKNLTLKSEDVQISESRRRLCDENLKLAAVNDRILKQAYEELDDSTTSEHRLQTIYEVIIKLDKLPHLYNPDMREESTETHVTKWLHTHTDEPEPEWVGFTGSDLLEPRRFMGQEAPRVSNSDTNVLLGKRKRVDKDDKDLDISRLHENSSDTLLVAKGDFVRPHKIAKRQTPPKEES